MDYRVIKDFIAREDCKQYKAGELFACLESDRAKILIERGYIKPEADSVPEPEKPQKAKAKRAVKKKE